jgi:dTMP kinase
VAGGFFVALEGGEGAGKSTLARLLGSRLATSGRDCIVTREPGGTPFGEALRPLLASELDPWTEAFCFCAARAQLVGQVIRPALGRGAVVVCDRFSASTFAYQGYGRGLALEQLRVANEIATGGLMPDLTLLLDIDPNAGIARKSGEAQLIRTGAEPRAFHEAVRDGYLTLRDQAPSGSWLTIDASLATEEVVEIAWRAVTEQLRR